MSMECKRCVCGVVIAVLALCSLDCRGQEQPAADAASTEGALEGYRIVEYLGPSTWIAVREAGVDPSDEPDVMWKIKGRFGATQVPHELIYEARWSEKLDRVVILTFKGVFLVPPAGGDAELVWSKELLREIRAFSPDGDQVFVCGMDTEKWKKFVAVIDLNSRTQATYYIDETPSGMIFTRSGYGLATFRDIRVVSATFAAGAWRFRRLPATRAIVGTIVGGRPVYVQSRDDASALSWSTHEVVIPGEVASVTGVPGVWASEAKAYVLTTKGELLEVREWKTVRPVRTVKDEDVIGFGVSARGMWLITADGKATVYGRERVDETLSQEGIRRMARQGRR